MNCPVVDFHKNRNKKWWLKYIGGWIIGMVTCTIVNIPNAMWEEYNEKQDGRDVKHE